MKRGRYAVQPSRGFGIPEDPLHADSPGEASSLAHDTVARRRDVSIAVYDRRTRIALMSLPRQDRCHPFGWTPAQCVAWLAICCTFGEMSLSNP